MPWAPACPLLPILSELVPLLETCVPLGPRQESPTSLVPQPLHQALPKCLLFTFELSLTHSGSFLSILSGWTWEPSGAGNHSEWRQCFRPSSLPFTSHRPVLYGQLLPINIRSSLVCTSTRTTEALALSRIESWEQGQKAPENRALGPVFG